MKKAVLLFLVFVISFVGVLKAQEYLDFNTGANRTKRILLVPFDPRIYYNDATAIIARNTGETHDEIMLYFREQFSLQLYNAMMDSCTVVNLLTDNTRQAQEDISGLYSSISYELRLAMQNNPEDPDEVENMNFFLRRRYEKEQKKKNEAMDN